MRQIRDYIQKYLRYAWYVLVAWLVVQTLLQGNVTPWAPLWILLAHYVWYMLGFEVGYHRLFSHRSFQTNILIKKLLAIIGTLLDHPTLPVWVHHHRLHHAGSDKKEDPYDVTPYKNNLLGYLFNNKNLHLNDRFKIAEFDTTFYRIIMDYQFVIIWLFSVPMIGLFGVENFLIFYAIPSIISKYFQGIANYISHQGEYRGFDFSQNLWWLEFTSPGMGFHGDHHDRAGHPIYSIKHPNLDMSGWVIRLIRKR